MMRHLFIIILLCLCISCTTTRYVDRPIPVETVRTEYVNLLYRDTVIERDSVDRFIKGDTLIVYKYKYRYKYLNKTDTVIRTDSIEIPVEIKTVEIKEVNKIRWYLSVLMWLGGLSAFLLLFKLTKMLKTKMKE